MLSSIPSELVNLILEKLSTRDLSSVSQLSKKLHELALPYLYHTIIIWLDEKIEILPRFKSLLSTPRDRFRATKRLEVRFPHFSDEPASCPTKEEGVGEGKVTVAGAKLIPYLQLFEDDSLCEFSFFLCICIIPELFRESGFFHKHQRRLEELNIYTAILDGYMNIEQMDPLLTEFQDLKSFTWRQALTLNDFKAIRDLILAKSAQLQALDLEVAPTTEQYLARNNGNALRELGFLDIAVWEVEGGCPFRSLKSLTLAHVGFKPIPSLRVCKALNIGALKRLSLWNCDGTMELLKTIIEQKLELRLTHLELVRGVHRVDMIEEIDFWEILQQFLKTFGGLKELYLLIPGPASWDSICDSINRRHGDTLRRVVVHQRERTFASAFEDSADRDFEWTRSVAQTLCIPQLDCFGVCCNFESLTDVLSDLDMSPAIKILHVRRSRRDMSKGTMMDHVVSNDSASEDAASDTASHDDPAETQSSYSEDSDQDITPEFKNLDRDLFDLASEAFGPEGIPNLQILAYGDFSLYGQQWEKNVLLCRNDKHRPRAKRTRCFRWLGKRDTFLNELLQENMRMLGACVLEGVRPDKF